MWIEFQTSRTFFRFEICLERSIPLQIEWTFPDCSAPDWILVSLGYLLFNNEQKRLNGNPYYVMGDIFFFYFSKTEKSIRLILVRLNPHPDDQNVSSLPENLIFAHVYLLVIMTLKDVSILKVWGIIGSSETLHSKRLSLSSQYCIQKKSYLIWYIEIIKKNLICFDSTSDICFSNRIFFAWRS